MEVPSEFVAVGTVPLVSYQRLLLFRGVVAGVAGLHAAGVPLVVEHAVGGAAGDACVVGRRCTHDAEGAVRTGDALVARAARRPVRPRRAHAAHVGRGGQRGVVARRALVAARARNALLAVELIAIRVSLAPRVRAGHLAPLASQAVPRLAGGAVSVLEDGAQLRRARVGSFEVAGLIVRPPPGGDAGIAH